LIARAKVASDEEKVVREFKSAQFKGDDMTVRRLERA